MISDDVFHGEFKSITGTLDELRSNLTGNSFVHDVAISNDGYDVRSWFTIGPRRLSDEQHVFVSWLAVLISQQWECDTFACIVHKISCWIWKESCDIDCSQVITSVKNYRYFLWEAVRNLSFSALIEKRQVLHHWRCINARVFFMQ